MLVRTIAKYEQKVKMITLDKPISWNKENECRNNLIQKPEKILYEGHVRRLGSYASLVPKHILKDKPYCLLYVIENSTGSYLSNESTKKMFSYKRKSN